MRRLRLLIVFGLVLLAPPAFGQHVTVVYNKDMKPTHIEDLSYPSIAYMAGIQGVVVVRATLDADGKVAEAEVLSGPEALTLLSVENTKKWHFEPNPEHSAIVVYNFRIEGVCQTEGVHSQMIVYPPNFAVVTGCQPMAEP